MSKSLWKCTSVPILFICLVVSGCAGIDAAPVANDEQDRGIRYYERSTFLLVHTDNNGGLTSKVVYLPDMKKKMSLKPYNYLASNNATLTFDKGMLTQSKAVVDETIIPKAVIAGLEKAASAVIAAANAPTQAKRYSVPAPYMFRIQQDNKGNWSLQGGQGPEGIRVTVGKGGS